jgi:hypothetical protein
MANEEFKFKAAAIGGKDHKATISIDGHSAVSEGQVVYNASGVRHLARWLSNYLTQSAIKEMVDELVTYNRLEQRR